MLSDHAAKSDAAPPGALAALIICAALVIGLMPLSIARVDDAPQIVEQGQSMPIVEVLPEPPVQPRLRNPADDAAGQTSRLFKRLRALDAREKLHRERTAQRDLQFDEFP